jgi:hypothetical protein
VKRLKEPSYRSFGPQKFCDLLPEPAPALPPAQADAPSIGSRPPSPCHSLDSDAHPLSIEPIKETPQSALETTKNAFGIYRRYFSKQFPTHDPEGDADVSNLSNIVDSGTNDSSEASYGPYLNESSFRLGEWYWNHGAEKTQSGFRELIKIVGDEGFRPLDVQGANWTRINEHLASGGKKQGCLDKDAGWMSSTVKISVPFHRFTQQPGAQDYFVANFHHRSLVSVITEKLTNERDARFFHYEPYELRWPGRTELTSHLWRALYIAGVSSRS